jgi:hypothetical protein
MCVETPPIYYTFKHSKLRPVMLLLFVVNTSVTGLGDPQGCETSRLPYFLDNSSQIAVRLSALRTGRPLPPGRFLVLISDTG